MGSETADKIGCENVRLPRYKRRRVSAIRDFPPGCGPNASLIGIKDKLINSVECCGGEKGSCLNMAENGKQMGIDHGGRNNFGTNPELQDSEAFKSSQDMLQQEAILPVVEFLPHRNSSENLAVEVNHRLTEKELETKKVTDKNGGDLCSLTYYPIPSNRLSREKKFPPRRRVSAIRHFPPGCGPSRASNVVADTLKVTLPKVTSSSGGEGEDAKCSVIVGAVVDDMKEQFKDDGALESNTLKGAFKETRDQPPTDSSGIAANELLQICNSSVVEEPLRKDEDDTQKLDESGSGDPTSSGEKERNPGLEDILNKERVDYGKGKGNKRKSTSISGGDMSLRVGQMSDVNDIEGALIVQGLMAAPTSPWRHERAAVKSAPSTTAGKGNRFKDSGGGNNLPNTTISNDQDDLEKSRGEDEGKDLTVSADDTEEGAPQVVLWDNVNDSKDDEEKLNDFQPVSCSHAYDLSLPPSGFTGSSDGDSRRQVREVLRLFQAIMRKLTQEEEATQKKKGAGNASRADQVALRILKDKGKHVNTGKPIIGPVPGVEVGDEFHFRAELMIVGLHRPPVGGIDYVKQGDMPLATSIVASGRYDNEVESSDSLIYTGQGGSKINGKEPEDQKLVRGNLALKNSSEVKNYVRVIRGSKQGKIAIYTYDGLYTVDRYWQEVGPHGKMVYKFELKRLPGQPELACKEVKKLMKSKEWQGRCMDDISGGKERFPISAVNTLDDEKPPTFIYVNSMIYPKWYHTIPPKGCDCVGGCSDSEKCACAVRNGGEIPFNFNGAIVEAKPLVYECGTCCKCPPSCHNRVSQHGIKFQLEIFKTESRGWGVRSLSSIPSGSFICEYIGELLEDKEAEQRTGNDEYLFDIGQNYNDQDLWGGLSTIMPDAQSNSSDLVEEGFTIDAAKFANVGRFINHSCSPNLYAQNLLYDNDDKRFPHIMLFAAENIPPLQELTYHYNYSIDEVRDSDGNIKIKHCYCGASDCTGRMY